MRIALLVQRMPHPAGGGTALAGWSLLEGMRAVGHEVMPVVLTTPSDPGFDASHRHYREALAAQGVAVTLIPATMPPAPVAPGRLAIVRSALFPSVDRFYPSAAYAETLEGALRRIEPDVVYALGYGAINALRTVRVAPRMASLGDPHHEVLRYRLALMPRRPVRPWLYRALEYVGARRILPSFIVEAARDYEDVMWFAAHHAAWLTARGVPCRYLPVPVADQIGADWRSRRAALGGRGVTKIVMLGGLSGTQSRLGLRGLLQLLPHLDRGLGRYEVHIIGHGSPPPEVARLAAHPAVRLRGFVDDIRAELLSSDVFLEPSRYPVGIRSRVVTAMSFGCAVVADPAVGLGIAELRHGENALLARGAARLAEAVVEAARDPRLRAALGEGARRTYEETFAVPVAGRRIVDALTRIARPAPTRIQG